MQYDEALPGSGDPFASINEYGTVNYADMNRGVTPIFFNQLVPHPALTEESGRPRWVNEERVRILVAGDTLNSGVYPVTEEYKQRFADAYAKFKEGAKERHIEGTPLSQWPMMTPLMIKELEALNIFSVEDLSNLADGNVTRHPDGRMWRERAKAYLAHAKDSAAATKYAAENERQREKMEEMQKQMIAMRDEINKLKGK